MKKLTTCKLKLKLRAEGNTIKLVRPVRQFIAGQTCSRRWCLCKLLVGCECSQLPRAERLSAGEPADSLELSVSSCREQKQAS